MAPQRRSREGRAVLVEVLDIPIFFIRRLGDRQFVVGGGGGMAKTGIPNAVYLFSLTIRDGRCYLRQSQKVDTGTASPMNVAVYEVTSSSLSPIIIDPRTRLPGINHGNVGKDGVSSSTDTGAGQMSRGRQARPANRAQQAEKEIMTMLSTVKEFIAVGLNNSCAVYQVNRSLPKQPQPDPSTSLKTLIAKDDLISILFRESIETVNGGDAAQQCCVFIPPDPTRQTGQSAVTAENATASFNSTDAGLATGGSDGNVRIWAGSDFHLVATIKAHEDEVTDMDISSTGDEIITCGRDKKAHVWNLKTGKLIASAQPDFSEAKGVAYRPRKVRFHSKESSALYIIWIPVVRQRKQQDLSVLCLYRFRSSNLKLVASIAMKGELLSALSVSPDGHYLATGNLEGTVCILRADSLDVIYSAASAHETFVTDLEFADCTFGAKILTQTENAQCTVFSVSADRKILLHQADFRYAKLKSWRKWMKWPVIFWMLAVLCSFVSLIDYITELTSSFHGPI